MSRIFAALSSKATLLAGLRPGSSVLFTVPTFWTVTRTTASSSMSFPSKELLTIAMAEIPCSRVKPYRGRP